MAVGRAGLPALPRRMVTALGRAILPLRLLPPQDRQGLGDLAALGLNDVQEFFRRPGVFLVPSVRIDRLQVINRVLDIFGLTGQFAGFLRQGGDPLLGVGVNMPSA